MQVSELFSTLRGRTTAPVVRMLQVGVFVGILASSRRRFPPVICRHAWLPSISRWPRRHGGAFHTEDGAGLTLVGQPNMEKRTLDNPIVVPHALSVPTYQRWNARVQA